MDDSDASSAMPEELSCDSWSETYQAALKAIAAGKLKKAIPLAPWEELSFFGRPKWNTVTFALSAAVQLVQADPHRIALVMQSSSTVRICTEKAHLEGGGGLSFQSGSLCTLHVLQKHYGPLCQAEWWGISPSSSGTVEICEILLDSWPS